MTLRSRPRPPEHLPASASEHLTHQNPMASTSCDAEQLLELEPMALLSPNQTTLTLELLLPPPRPRGSGPTRGRENWLLHPP